MFSDSQLKELNKPLAKENVKVRDGTGTQKLSYLASYHVINEANRIFGFGNWSTEIMHIHQVDKTEYEKPPYKAGDNPKPMVSVSYSCHIKLIVRDGTEVVSHEDVGFGNGVAGNNAYGLASCIELASKESVTDALKRCMRYYGDQFGLSLYDKDNQLMSYDDIEMTELATVDQLADLRALYPVRDIDDEWVLTALKAENYPGKSLSDLRQDWYHLAFKLTQNYKIKDIEKAGFEVEMTRLTGLMKKSVNQNMLKALYIEAYNKAKSQDDKQTIIQLTKLKDEIKARIENDTTI